MRELQVITDDRLGRVVFRTRTFEGIEVDYNVVETMTTKEARSFAKSILLAADKVEEQAMIRLSDGSAVRVADARVMYKELSTALEKCGHDE